MQTNRPAFTMHILKKTATRKTEGDERAFLHLATDTTSCLHIRNNWIRLALLKDAEVSPANENDGDIDITGRRSRNQIKEQMP